MRTAPFYWPLYWPLFSRKVVFLASFGKIGDVHNLHSLMQLGIVQAVKKIACRSWGAKGPGFKSRRPDHFSVRGILVHIFHGPANSTHRRGGRFPLLLTRCGEPFSTADRSGAAALPWAGQAFSGAARRMRAARFVRLASNELQNGAPLRISEVGGWVGRSARAARPPRRAAGSAFWFASSKGGEIPARSACRRR